jgi:hypothetical protein
VSGPIKCEDRPEAAARLAYAAGRLRAALAHDSDERSVRRSLAELWPEFVAVDPGGSSKARIVAASRSGGTLSVAGAGLLSVTSGSPLKAPRSFGD